MPPPHRPALTKRHVAVGLSRRALHCFSVSRVVVPADLEIRRMCDEDENRATQRS